MRAAAGPGASAAYAMLQNYVPILIFLGVAAVLGSVLIGLGFLLGPRKPDAELSPTFCPKMYDGYDAIPGL